MYSRFKLEFDCHFVTVVCNVWLCIEKTDLKKSNQSADLTWKFYPEVYPECWIPVNLQATTENSSLSALLDFILKK